MRNSRNRGASPSQVRAGLLASYLGETAEVIPYHYVLEGRMGVQVTDGLEFEMEPGSLVMFPRNDTHLLGSDLRLPPTPSAAVVHLPTDGGLANIRLGGDGARTRIMCGFLGGENLLANPVVSALPAAA